MDDLGRREPIQRRRVFDQETLQAEKARGILKPLQERNDLIDWNEQHRRAVAVGRQDIAFIARQRIDVFVVQGQVRVLLLGGRIEVKENLGLGSAVTFSRFETDPHAVRKRTFLRLVSSLQKSRG